MKLRSRKSVRLKGYDYAQPGAYFVTVCTNARVCMLGEVVEGDMRLSEVGKIVDVCWREIPKHFLHVKVGVYQIMPNHVHGIICITKPLISVRAQHAAPVQSAHLPRQSLPNPGSLSVIVRSFKSVSTKLLHEKNLGLRAIWHRGFYDRVIRDDAEHHFIQQYVELNPVLWHLDRRNPDSVPMSEDKIRAVLQERHGLTGMAVECVLEHVTTCD